MRRLLRQRPGELYILIIGLVMFAGAIFAASYHPQPPGAVPPSAQAEQIQQQSPGAPASAPVSAAQTQQPSGAAPASAPALTAQNTVQPNAPADSSARQTAQAQPAPAEPAKPPAEPAKPANAANQPPGHDMKAMAAAQPQPSTAAQRTPAQAAAGAMAPDGDPAAGRQVFRKCQACHSLEPGKNILGPSLGGIIGRKAGGEAGYNYSPAMKQANITWDPKTLDAYLADPAKTVPGNKMPFPGLKTEHDRKDVIAYLAGAEGAQQSAAASNAAQQPQAPAASAQEPQAPPPTAQAPQSQPGADIGYIPDARYTLRSGIAEGRMVYIGVGGTMDGKVNPVLTAAEGQVVQLTLINGEGAEHDIVFPDQDTRSPRVTGKGSSTTIAFRATKSGDFTYYCSVPGHQLAGMLGQFIVTSRPPPQTLVEADISREPNDLPPPIGKREPRTVRVDLLSAEIEARLAEGTTFGYWTFNGKVPAPFIRVRVGDTVDIHLKNSPDSSMIHSVDFHATTGPGGGAAALQVDPGQEKSMTWKALVPGLFVYHCATPMVAEHIANGMYGLILVEPEGGLPPVDREFYVMQGEIYTDAPYGQHGSAEFSVEKLLNERPEYFVFNGSVGALSKLHPLEAKVGETVRIFFGVGGPNYTSSFHVIGEIFDKVYALGGVASPPLEGIQTVTVPAGGAVITEFKLEVPGNYTLVDHALARAERGLVGILHVEGPPNPDIYNGQTMPGMGH
jgi:nitrite reductase (NO-forming)